MVSQKLMTWAAKTLTTIKPKSQSSTPQKQGRVQVPTDKFEKHTYIIGRAGSGKTNLVKNLIVQTMRQGHGLTFMDVHGDAVEELVGLVPPSRVRDVVYFDPSEEHAPAFNIFGVPYEPDKLTTDIVKFLKAMYSESWGQRMDYILTHGIYTLICDMRDNGTSRSFKDLERTLKDQDFRNHLVRTTKRDSERVFWLTEFPRMPRNAIDPILNKVSYFFLSGSMSERIFSEPENQIVLPDILNQQKIFLVNLARGKLTKSYSSFLGAVLMQGIVEAAFTRAKQNPADRRMHHLFVDEFQEFIQGSPFEDILSQTRKYKLSVTMSHQLLSQLPGSLQANIFGNVTSKICFRISASDVSVMMREMKGKKTRVRMERVSVYDPYDKFVEFVRDHMQKQYAAYKQSGRMEDGWVARDMEISLRLLQSPTILPAALKEITQKTYGKRNKKDLLLFGDEDYNTDGVKLFPPIEILEELFPSQDDLMNLPPFVAFGQIDKASDVRRFRTDRCPDPDPRIANWIHERNKKRYEKRMARRKATPMEVINTPGRYDEDDPEEFRR
jgi:hypothetical protein